jgi:hypothetical protein
VPPKPALEPAAELWLFTTATLLPLDACPELDARWLGLDPVKPEPRRTLVTPRRAACTRC